MFGSMQLLNESLFYESSVSKDDLEVAVRKTDQEIAVKIMVCY